MTFHHVARIALGWSREQLAQASEVDVAAVYLFERMGSAGAQDDARIRSALIQAKLEPARGEVIHLPEEL